jgi:predicted dithiol-disulfide oxidoreductase (DUF899 family)
MTAPTTPAAPTLPKIVSRDEWLDARIELLAEEKRLTRQRDALAARRRALPMVRIEKQYVFDGPEGKVTLLDLFEGREQLVVQHIMFGPDWDAACPTCTTFLNELPAAVLDRLRSRQTSYVLVSRAPIAKIEAYRTAMGWDLPWYSAYGSDFNYDFQVSLDESVPQVHYNYRPEPSLLGGGRSCEMPGVSCFLREGEQVFHTYSCYARGLDHTDLGYGFLDLTVLGRQEEWEARVAPGS